MEPLRNAQLNLVCQLWHTFSTVAWEYSKSAELRYIYRLPIVMPDIDAHNPDHLAFIAYGFDDFENKRRNDIPIEDARLSSASRFLDSLAHIAICKPFGQVVAIGADLQEDGVQIAVAENNDVAPQVNKHLEDVMDALFDIRAALRDDHSIKRTSRVLKSLGLIAANDTRAIPSRIRQLELSVLRHSFPKIAARIHKGIRYQTFSEHATRFLAHCDGVAGGEDAYTGPLAESKKIKKIFMLVTNLYNASERPLHPTEKELEVFRVSSAVLSTLLVTSSGDVKALHDFCKVEDGFDSTRWLSKISSNRMHFTRVASIIDSSRLSPFLNCRATVSPLENPSEPLSFTITRASFTSILEAATWAPESEMATDATIDEVYILLAEGLRKLAKNPDETQITVRVRSLSVEPSAADEFDIVTSYGAHCECVVLEHLRKLANMPTTFVGVSKLSCRLYHLYFETDAGTYQTRGSHGELARWRCPISSSPETRRSMEERLLAIIKEKMTVKARHGRSSSQSTVGSNDDYSCDNESDFDDVIWAGYHEFGDNLPERVGLS